MSQPVYDADRYILKPLADDGTRGFRLEIDEFLGDNAMTNLYLLALYEMQQQSLEFVQVKRSGKTGPEPNWLKYYALGGIHAAPRDAWDGFKNDASVGPWGYCHHSKNTFPTWHRPYMMLYETAIQSEMVVQANKFSGTERAKYLDAAARFRLPYWDPIMPRHEKQGNRAESIWGLPDIFKARTVWVRKASSPDSLSEIPNPLWQFKFPDASEWNKPEVAQARKELNIPSDYNPDHTVRTPGLDGETDSAFLETAIQEAAEGYASNLWKMLSPTESQTGAGGVEVTDINQQRSWESFANATVNSATVKATDGRNVRVATVSVEQWHNNIHNLIGTGRDQSHSGMMGDPVWAGYEPMFWFHHSNIDRLLALYQSLYGKNVSPAEVNNPLVPFRKDSSNVYTSADDVVKHHWNVGYAIPGSRELPSDTVKANVKKYLTDTYYWATNKTWADKPLPNWPKDLTGSEALHGTNAKPAVTPDVRIRALTPDGNLVSRRLALQPKSAPKIEDTPIKTAQVLEHTAAVDNALPDNVISDVGDAHKPAYRVWDAHITARKFAFNGSYNIHVFIGEVKDDQPQRFLTRKNEVAFTGVFASPDDAQCGACKTNRDADIKVEDVIPLTTKLTDYLESNPKSEGLISDGNIRRIRSMEPADVVPFLTEQLQWRMTDMKSSLFVGQEQHAQLEVLVTSRVYTPPDADHLMGVYGPPTIHEGITSAKPGGFGYVYPPQTTQ